MLGAVRSALKARLRQFQVRDSVAELRESESELRFTLNAGRLGAWTLDLTSGDLITSATCRENFGRDPGVPFTYEQLRDAVHPEDRDRMAAAVERTVATGANYDIEYRLVTPAGELRWVQIRARPVVGADGQTVRLTGVSIDTTDRKRAEIHEACLAELADAIRDVQSPGELAYAAAAILGRALAVSRVGYATIDPVGETLHVERDWTAPGVRSRAGTLRLCDYGSFLDDLRRGDLVSIADARADDRTAPAAGALEAQSARSFVAVPVIEQGRLVAALFVDNADVRDWTAEEQALIQEVGERTRTAVERSRVDAALRDSETRYRTLFERVEQGFCVIEVLFDADGRPADYRFEEVNPAFEAQTGLVDAVGRRIGELAPNHEQRWYDIYGAVALTGDPVRGEEYAESLGRWYEYHAFRVGTPEQRRVAVLFNDVSERKSADARIREMNETLERQVAERTDEIRRFRDIVEATTSPICAFDRDYRLIAFNKAHNDEFRRVNGFDTKLGDVFPDLFIAEQQPVMRALMARALSGEAFTIAEEFGRPELGQPSWEISYTPLRDAHGTIIGAFHLATDISERLRGEQELALAQEALRQSQKMEAMGSLTGGVAHDFNNLLTPIVGSLDLLQRKGLGNERERRLIAGAVQSAERAKTLVQRLLAFARRQPLRATAVDLAPLVHGMADLVSSTTGPQIRVVVDAEDDLPAAKVDPNQLEMAILNLAVNARDAMPDGGTLRISVSSQTVETGNEAAVAPGGYLRLSVTDTGMGMDEATLKRAIEPFFSTKGVGKGTGLGLSMAHGLASQLGGALTISSTPGIGTAIDLWLPESVDPVSAENRTVDEAAEISRSGVVLLVDDEELVRLSTADMLVELGYSVVEARSGEEALELVGRGLEPDLLVTDHLMPGISGTELARTVRTDLPDTRVLIVSGYAEAEGIDPDLPRLTKPFRNADLAESLATLT
ncbi:PAS domain-containing protein [uncultured Sphingomonas sp.]|uniref:PAS domain-containing protein n=1 Tax=uncultured Sphingomonas sp. TaxID=158754 RepID=UPI0035CA4FC0